MKVKSLLITICALLLGIFNAFAQDNVLSIPDVLVPKGKSIALPINLNNTADVVALQFTLTTPEGITLDASSATLTERSDGHSVTFQKTGANTYMAMVFSSNNNSIKGRTGKLFSVTLNASSSIEEGAVLPLTLSDVVIGARDGSNLTTGFSAGKVTVAKSPDLEVSNVTIDKTTIVPHEKVTVGWQVANIGGLATTAGWNEQILLESASGTTKLLGTVYYDESLTPNGVVSRNAELTIPTLIGIDGETKIRVKLTANSNAGEPTGLQDNNEATIPQSVTVKKVLALTPEYVNIDESQTKTVRFQLTRSGSTANDEIFTLTRNADSRILLPETITISKGQSGVYFYAQLTANGVLDNDSIVNFTISGNDYPEIASKLVIEDDTYPSLNITTDEQDVTEGGSIKFTISTERISTRDIEVKLSCDLDSRFEIPSNIIIPAGQQSVDVMVNAKEDDVPDVEQMVTFVVTAAGHNNASTYTILLDNDVPTLKMEILPNAISEAAGPLAVTAKLTRTDNIDKLVTVKLSDDSNGNVYYGRQTIEMAAGVKEVTVNLGPIDNAIVDGERTYNISAAVFIASCSCNANNGTSGGVVSVPLTIYDNDGPTLTMTTSSSILKEGGEIEVTIKRNTNTFEALTVNISSDHEASIEYPSTVVIPAGATEATFTVKSKGNDISGDGFTAMLTATVDGFSTGNIWFTISDQTLPDAQITDIKVISSSFEIGDTVNVIVSLTNTGNATLPASIPVKVYSGNQSNEIAARYTQFPIDAGQSMDINLPVVAPASVGAWPLYAVVNGSKQAQELEYTNNTSNIRNVDIKAPFNVTVNIPKSLYNVGEEVRISGQASGRNAESAKVEIYIINQGHRYVLNATTDSEGCFNVVYTPFEKQFGHFIIGACFPGENLVNEQCYFDIYGMRLSDNSAITCDVLKNETFNGSIILNNPGKLPLSNIRAIITNEPKNCEIVFGKNIDILEGGKSQTIDFKLKGLSVSPKLAWENAEIQIVSDEGVKVNTKLYYYVREPQGKLEADIASINTSVSLGSSRDYAVILTNIGKGETGDIKFSLPSWMHLATASQIPSLATGETATVILTISTNEQMSANVTRTGHIGINCETGIGLSIPYTIEPVSELTGILAFDICDEFTYYTAEAPHVSGAKIQIKHPVTGELIAEGVSDIDGKYDITLSEGYYSVSVTAEKHESYSKNIYVDPGRTNNVIVNIGYTAITYDFVVEETEIEDEYKIVTKVVYETNVPVPCVILSIPEKIDGDNMRAGESTLVYFTLTNKGLITAMDVTVNMPEDTDEWRFEALTNIDPFDLSPQQTITIPVRITRLKDENSTNSRQGMRRANITDYYRNCMTVVSSDYGALCGNDLKHNKAAERMAMKMCGLAATGATIFDALSSLYSGSIGSNLGNPGGGGTKHEQSEIIHSVSTGQSFNMCDTCDAQKAEELLDVLISKTWLKNVNEGMDIAARSAQDMRDTGESTVRRRMTRKAYEQLQNEIREQRRERAVGKGGAQIISWLAEIVDVIEIATRECPGANESRRRVETKSSSRSWQVNYNNVANRVIDYIVNYDSLLYEFFGDKIWYEGDIEDKEALFELLFNSENVTIEQALAIKPLSVTEEQVIALLERINNTIDGNETTNCINWNKIDSIVNTSKTMDEQSISEGYESLAEQYQEAYDICMEQFGIMSSSVCTSITLQFSQKMLMTRQAFRGTLTLFNGNETTAMSDVKLSLTIKDESGTLATSHEFQINAESLAGFEGQLSLMDGWKLDAQETGTATILFIPTKYAAPNVEKVYYFGGSLSYIDPFTGLEVTRTLTPIALTVKPSPNLDLTYFMQRDIIGDDPLTETIEPSEEAEFALLINNIGYGDATNVQMMTEQPKIIENEKGLLIDFELMSSQLNGGDKTLALGGSVATDFGTIPAMSTAYAQWWIKSSLLGHFTDYNVEATHVTNYGNPDLSLLNEVTIHELIRSLEVADGRDKMVGFMTNDITDAEDTPDMIYLSNGEIESVATAQSAVLQKSSDTDYLLKVVPAQEGWNYGNVSDPTYGTSKLKLIVRQSDSKEIPLRNFWQTDRTLRDGKDPLYENRIHFADNMVLLQEETYILTFEPQPELELEVESYAGVPEENTVLKEQLTEVTVKFNKPIKVESFTTEDISISCQGKALNASQIVITKVNEQEYKLGLQEVTLTDGYYVLTVQTANIMDTEGFTGSTGKQASWTQFVDGKVALKLMASPAEGGSISPNSGRFDYDTDVTVKATPVEGYDFVAWTMDGKNVSTEREYTHHLMGNTELKAVFSIKHYNVTISDNSQNGTIEGASSGIYEYGTQLQLTANPDDEYIFDAWLINDERDSETEHYTITVNSDMTIDALFKLKSTSIESIDSDVLHIKITPIPVHDMMYLSGNFSEIRIVNIYDMRGGKCLTAQNVQPDQSIYVGRLSAGIYYIQIVTDKGVYNAKVLKR